MAVNNNESREHVTKGMDRRRFLQSTASAGAGLVLTPGVFGESKAGKSDDINVALIGLGTQCGRLMEAISSSGMEKNDGIRFKAVCDIFPYRLEGIARRLSRTRKYEVNSYESYEEMLAKEKGLDAAIIATPDWVHAPMTIACLKAGLHVYCEKEMSNNLADAKKMLQTAKETGKLLQIGHQRRSNPRYLAARNLIGEHKLIGKLLNINAQWNRGKDKHRYALPKKNIWVDEGVLKRHGYGSMEELTNWRWYKKFGGGPLGDLGSHQIDIFGWFLGDVKPKSVMASGGRDYYKYEHNENVMALYDYETSDGSVRAFYQVLNTTCWGTYGTYYETFMGDIGTVLLSERTWGNGKNAGWAFCESYAMEEASIAERWNKCIRGGLIGGEYEMPQDVKNASILKIGSSIPGGPKVLHYHPLLRQLSEPVHQPHLKNFFEAIRHGAALNCPGEVAYETAVAVLKANEAIERGNKLEFKAEDFEV